MKPYDDISERISMDARLHRRLSKAAESTIAKFMARKGVITISDVGDDFMLHHPTLVRAAIQHLFGHWFEEVNWRHTNPELAMEAMEKLSVMVAPYAKENPEITVGEALRLEEKRILDKLEEGLV